MTPTCSLKAVVLTLKETLPARRYCIHSSYLLSGIQINSPLVSILVPGMYGVLWVRVLLWHHSKSFVEGSELYSYAGQQQSRDMKILDKADTGLGTRNLRSPPRQISKPLAYRVFLLLLPSKHCMA